MGEVKKVHPMIDYGRRMMYSDYETFRFFEGYLNLIEPFLKSEYEKRQLRYQELLEKAEQKFQETLVDEEFGDLPQVVNDLYFQMEFDDWMSSTHYFLLRESFVIALYAFFEAKWKDMGEWFDLEKFDTGKSKEWCLIQNYRRLRNCLAHASGDLDKIPERFKGQKRKLKTFITQNKNLSLSGGRVIVEKGFCEEALKVVEKLFDTVMHETPWKQSPWEKRK